jgi:hypothetical protein
MDQTTSAHQSLFGTSPNALRSQIWTAIAGYLLVAILKKRLHREASLYTVLQILSLTLFEKIPVSPALAPLSPTSPSPDTDNHQCLLRFQRDRSGSASILLAPHVGGEGISS